MDIKRLLKTRLTNLYPEAWKPSFMRRPGSVWKGPSYRRRSRRWLDLLFVTDHLAALVKSNAPLVAGLQEAVSLDAPNSKIEALVLTLREDLEKGTSLADAMERRPRFFPMFYVDLVRAGEMTGSLHDSLLQGAEELERRLLVRSAWTAFVVYVGTILLMQLTIFFYLTIKVLPVFAEMLSDFGSGVPAPTQFMVDIGSHILVYGESYVKWGILAVFVFGPIFFLLQGRRRLRKLLKDIACRLPVVGTTMIKGELARAGFILGKLLKGGVPLPEALGKVEGLDLNSAHKRLFARLSKRIAQGQTLREALAARSRFFPATFCTVVALGETSGTLPEAFRDVSELYFSQSSKEKAILADLLLPFLILIAAGVSLLGCLGVYLPIWSMTDVLIATL